MGMEVTVVSSKTAQSRTATVGRVKIERRPFRLVRWKDSSSGNVVGTFVQQAETVRLITSGDALNHEDFCGTTPGLVSVTELKQGTKLLGWNGGGGRHVGVPIKGKVTEK